MNLDANKHWIFLCTFSWGHVCRNEYDVRPFAARLMMLPWLFCLFFLRGVYKWVDHCRLWVAMMGEQSGIWVILEESIANNTGLKMLGGPNGLGYRGSRILVQIYLHSFVYWSRAGRSMALFCSCVAPPLPGRAACGASLLIQGFQSIVSYGSPLDHRTWVIRLLWNTFIFP